jgi:hypothetical protein
MTTTRKILFHQDFVSGRLDTPTFVDLGYMKALDLGNLKTWFTRVLRGEQLEGLNKPSWMTNGGIEINGAELYKQNNIWHYHCGVYVNQPGDPIAWTNANLDMNVQGKTSAAVYHYAKTSDAIVILGYSPEHVPFPGATDPNNPLVSRTSRLTKTLDLTGGMLIK